MDDAPSWRPRALHMAANASTRFSYAEWRREAVPGYCGTTSSAGDCTRGSKGSLGLKPSEGFSLRGAVHACLRKCDACERCQYITVSPRHGDCSWYARCDLGRLRTAVKGMLSSAATDEAKAWARIPLPRAPAPARGAAAVAAACELRTVSSVARSTM